MAVATRLGGLGLLALIAFYAAWAGRDISYSFHMTLVFLLAVTAFVIQMQDRPIFAGCSRTTRTAIR